MSIWLIILIGLIIFSIATSEGTDSNNTTFEQNKENKVIVVNMSSMTKIEVDTWCKENKVNCTIKSEYSNAIEKKFIHKSKCRI